MWWDPRFDLVGKILASLMMQIGVTQGGAHRPSGRAWGGHQHHLRQQGRAVALYGCHQSPGERPTPVSNDNRQRMNETGPVTGVSGNTTLDRGMTTTGDEVMWSGGVTHRTGDRPAVATAGGSRELRGSLGRTRHGEGGQSGPGESLGCAALM